MCRLTSLRCEAPLPPLEGEVPNEREAEGFVRKLSNKVCKPLSFAALSSSPFRGAKAATPQRDSGRLLSHQHQLGFPILVVYPQQGQIPIHHG